MKISIVISFLLLTQSLYAASADVLFFNQDCNIDAPVGADNTCEDERYNLLNVVSSLGHNVTLLSDFHQADLATLLRNHDFLMIPDLEDHIQDCNISDPAFIAASEKLVLQEYVENGGRLLITGSGQNIAFLNDLFQLELMSAGFASVGYSHKDSLEAIGTSYEACPDSIKNLSATFLITSTMPASKKCIYQQSGGTSLAEFTFGTGTIVYIGYDFFDAGPGCTNNRSEWVTCVFDRAITSLTPVIVPTLSQWGVIILFLLLSILGAVVCKASSLISLSST